MGIAPRKGADLHRVCHGRPRSRREPAPHGRGRETWLLRQLPAGLPLCAREVFLAGRRQQAGCLPGRRLCCRCCGTSRATGAIPSRSTEKGGAVWHRSCFSTTACSAAVYAARAPARGRAGSGMKLSRDVFEHGAEFRDGVFSASASWSTATRWTRTNSRIKTSTLPLRAGAFS